MNDFLLVYQGGDPNWAERDPEELEAVMAQWRQWFEDLEASGNLRNAGAPLAPGAMAVRKNGDSIVTDTPMIEVKELIGGYSVLQAESMEQAAELAKGCPFLANNADGRILVRPVATPGG